MMETAQRNTELRRKVKNVGRPGDDPKNADTSKLAKQGEIKTKIIDEAAKKVKEDDQTDDAIGRINAVADNLKQISQPKPTPSLPNVDDHNIDLLKAGVKKTTKEEVEINETSPESMITDFKDVVRDEDHLQNVLQVVEEHRQQVNFTHSKKSDLNNV